MNTSTDEYELEFHTVRNFSLEQIPVVIFFACGGIFGIVWGIFFTSPEDKLWVRILGVTGLAFGLLVLFMITYHWFTDAYHVKLKGNLIEGRSLFGREFSMDISKVASVNKLFSMNGVYFFDGEQKFIICGDIDFHGFITDYILERVPADAVLDEKHIKKYRHHATIWSYTRRYPFNTKYPDGYLAWIQEKAEEQKQSLIQKGILSSKLAYADEDIHVEKEEYRKYVPDWWLKEKKLKKTIQN